MTCGWRRSAFPTSPSTRCASMRGWHCSRLKASIQCKNGPHSRRARIEGETPLIGIVGALVVSIFAPQICFAGNVWLFTNPVPALGPVLPI
jgi:hypothetical protein